MTTTQIRITVPLTVAQVDLLRHFVPVHFAGIDFCATRVKGTCNVLRVALELIDEDEAVHRAHEGSTANTDADAALVERNARVSVAALRRRLRRAIAA